MGLILNFGINFEKKNFQWAGKLIHCIFLLGKVNIKDNWIITWTEIFWFAFPRFILRKNDSKKK